MKQDVTRCLDEDQIKTTIQSYIEENIYAYAVLINGEWGSGKTYFVKNKIIPRIEKLGEGKKLKTLYVSLYGATSEADISKKICLSILRFLGEEKGGKIACDIADSKVGGKIALIGKTALSAISESFSINVNFEDLLSQLFQSEKYILVFDDLERCNMDINRSLGYINSFVEHYGAKVIIVANEDEIGKATYGENLELKYLVAASNSIKFPEKKTASNALNPYPRRNNDSEPARSDVDEIKIRAEEIFSENALYKQIKEKLIGTTIYYRPNLAEVVAIFANEPSLSDIAKNTLKRNVGTIVDLMESCEHYNLRTLQAAIRSFKLICDTIDELFDANSKNADELYNRLLIYCLYSSIQNKLGKPMETWGDGVDFRITSKFGDMNAYIRGDSIYGFKFIDELVESSKKDDKHIREVVLDYLTHQTLLAMDQADPFKLLDVWWENTDEFVTAQLSEIIEKLKRNEYNLALYPTIIMRVCGIVLIGIDEKYLDSIVFEMKKNVENAEEEITFDRFGPQSSSNEQTELFKKHFSQLETLTKKSNHRVKEHEIDSIFDGEDWAQKFDEHCIYKKSSSFDERCFFSRVPTEKLTGHILNGSSADIQHVRGGLHYVYEASNIRDWLSADLQSFELLKESLNQMDASGFDNIKKFQLKMLCNTVDKIIVKLSPEKEQVEADKEHDNQQDN